MAAPVVQRNDESRQYEARIDGELAGFAQFQLVDSLIVFPHTEVDPRFEGLGVGSALAQYALDDVRREGTRQVVPRCPFIKGWIVRHPEYDNLVYGAPHRSPEGES
jgi:predicted GNAT family acetyltransferase